MRKLNIYLDTSVISYLQQEDAPERMKDTLKLWNRFESKDFKIFLSQVTLNEVEQCPEPKRSTLYDYLSRIEYTILTITEEILELAQKTIRGVRAITNLEGYKDIDIVNPSVLLESEE